MTKDPVCGMTIEESRRAATSTYQGQTYSFCSKACQDAFDRDPEKFVSRADTRLEPSE